MRGFNYDDTYTETDSDTGSEPDSVHDDDNYNYHYFAQENAAYLSDQESETDILDQICIEEELEDYTEKVNGNYYIGSISQEHDTSILALSVKPTIFFKYDISLIQRYLHEYSGLVKTQDSVEIIQLKIMPNLQYACVVKTRWLRLVQKQWRKAYAQRNYIIERRKSLAALHYFELHGKHLDGLHYLPTIHGLMANH